MPCSAAKVRNLRFVSASSSAFIRVVSQTAHHWLPVRSAPRAGNRWLNHVLHIAAVVQLRNDTPGWAYFRRKRAEGKGGGLEAMRCLKRRLSDLVYRQLVADSRTPGADHDGWAGPGGHSGATLPSSAVDLPPDIDTSHQSLPGPATTTLTPARVPDQPPAASAAATQRRRAQGVNTQRPPDERS